MLEVGRGRALTCHEFLVQHVVYVCYAHACGCRVILLFVDRRRRMEASRHQRAALIALAVFVGGAGVAAVYARSTRRAKRQEELANIREKDVRIEDWRVVLMARGRRKILSATCLQLKVHACVRQELRSIAERRFDIQQEPRRRRLLTVAMRKWLVGFRLCASVQV